MASFRGRAPARNLAKIFVALFLERLALQLAPRDRGGDGRGVRSVLTLYELFYNETRTHLGLAKDAPRRHAVQRYGDIVTAQFCADCIIATPGYDFREGQLLDNPSPRHLRLRLRSARTAGLLCAFWESAKKSLCALAREIRTRSARY